MIKDSGVGLDLPKLFQLLGNSVMVDIIEALGRKERTLPELRDKLAQSKSLLCIYLTTLHKHGLIAKRKEDGKFH